MHSTVGTARLAGLAYAGLAVVGVAGFLVVRPRLFVAEDATATLANLMAQEALARGIVGLEMGIALTQALVALLLFRLFRPISGVAAGAVAAFGLINATMILTSAGLLATAGHVALDTPHGPPAGDTAATVQLMYIMSEQMWGVAAVFFGLWLLPLGWLANRSRWMPRPLGWLLIAGGVGYVLSAFLGYLVPGIGPVKGVLTAPATLGELWMVAYLLFRGVRRTTVPDGAADAPVRAPG